MQAKCTNNTYLAVGDGDKHIQTEYFPFTRQLEDDEIHQIQAVLGAKPSGCEALLSIYAPSLPPPPWPAWWPWLFLLLLLPLPCLGRWLWRRLPRKSQKQLPQAPPQDPGQVELASLWGTALARSSNREAAAQKQGEEDACAG